MATPIRLIRNRTPMGSFLKCGSIVKDLVLLEVVTKQLGFVLYILCSPHVAHPRIGERARHGSAKGAVRTTNPTSNRLAPHSVLRVLLGSAKGAVRTTKFGPVTASHRNPFCACYSEAGRANTAAPHGEARTRSRLHRRVIPATRAL